MAINYTILKSSIIYSSIWAEDSDTRIVWLTLLAMRNKDGEIFASMTGLAHAARVDVEATRMAIAKFLAPDPDSVTKENEGRRIVEIQGGWRLLNHDRVKAEAQAANKANYMQSFMADKRAHIKRAKTLPMAGEAEYMAAVKRGASENELNEIVEKNLPKTK